MYSGGSIHTLNIPLDEFSVFFKKGEHSEYDMRAIDMGIANCEGSMFISSRLLSSSESDRRYTRAR